MVLVKDNVEKGHAVPQSCELTHARRREFMTTADCIPALIGRIDDALPDDPLPSQASLAAKEWVPL